MCWRWLTEAGVVSRRPCKLKGLLLTPSAAAAGCTVYNGESDQDPEALSIAISTEDSREFTFPGGLELDRGLYLGGFANITGVLVAWEPKV